MGRLFTLFLLAGLSVGPALAAQGYTSRMNILKNRQRQELKALKLKQQYAKESLKNGQLTHAARLQLKHQLKSEERKLRERQRDMREELKDRNQLLKLGLNQLH
ncbi:MAG TPA: hypothetical protein VMW54_00620 [Terriglobia bacterium]|nr:hypothetical protein [Terriglobia bacterium]